MDHQREFKDWFKEREPKTYKNWNERLDEIREKYSKSFGKKSVFDVDPNDIKKSIDDIEYNLDKDRRFNVENKTFAEYNEASSNGIPGAILRTHFVKFIKEKYSTGSEQEKHTNKPSPRDNNQNNRINTTSSRKTLSEQSYKLEQQKNENIGEYFAGQIHEIKKRIEKLIIQVNKNCKNHNKPNVFSELMLMANLNEIGDICQSKNDFKNFALNLYIIIYEKTRERKSPHNKGNPYTYRLPNEFTKIGTKTREFFDIVGALRHEYAHSEPEYNIPINKISYPDVLEKLLGNKNEPTKTEEFQKLQIEILKRFEESMKTLLEIVKKEPTNP